MHRRETLKWLAVGGAWVLTGCQGGAARSAESPVLSAEPLQDPWQTVDPFLFCVHHDDRYPAANAAMGPAVSLEGRQLGRDFAGKDGWRMYHGLEVPGFPQHPHRGFETVTVVRRGLLDHSDSLGATARYGSGDVQWLTAGAGIQHAEMFPLLDRSAPNPLELFQIWLNLPAADKFATPHFSMLWADRLTRLVRDGVQVTQVGPAPPRSWAARADTDVAIWSIKLAPRATWTLPAARAGSRRVLYYFRGDELRIAGAVQPPRHAIEVRAEVAASLAAGAGEVELLMLQGRPIGEPVARRGPFVMNTAEEIADAYADFRRTQFGGWPWADDDPVHSPDETRFARHADGMLERPT